jgi:hypothetical protein
MEEDSGIHIGDGKSEFSLIIEIKRADTGAIEHHELIGKVQDNGSYTLGSGTSGGNGRSDGTDRG